MTSCDDVSAKRAARWVWVQIPLLAATLTDPAAQWMLHLQTAWPSQLIWPARAVGLAGIVVAVMVFRGSQRQLGSELVATPAPTPTATLRETGVYGRVRHPIYVSIICGVAAWALLWSSSIGLGLGLLCLVFFLAKTRYEERLLMVRFTDYEAYRKRVPAYLPRLFPRSPHVPWEEDSVGDGEDRWRA